MLMDFLYIIFRRRLIIEYIQNMVNVILRFIQKCFKEVNRVSEKRKDEMEAKANRIALGWLKKHMQIC